jgi:predicted GNAT family acetyltransferase
MSIHHDADRRRYELAEAGGTAFAEYELAGPVITFTHTVVPAALRGRGIAGRLVAGALEDVRARGLKVVPACSYVARHIADHPDTQDLLASGSA